jgi:type I restriction enzyme S subunit
MQFGEFRDQCDEVKGQTDMADYVSLRDQQTMCLSLPDIGIQRVLGDVLGSLAERVELNRRMNGTLAALRDALLPKLMSGELRVRDAEKLAGTHV